MAEAKQKILILTGGGVGDQVCAEPTIRYAARQFPELEISVLTAFPEFFTHIRGLGKIFRLGQDRDIDVKQYCMRGTYPEGMDDLGKVLCSVHTNGVDYCAMLALKWMLPIKDRVINLRGKEPAHSSPGVVTALSQLHERAVLIHPGASWESKTFPAAWWVEVADYISAGGGLPVIIGAKLGVTDTVGSFWGRHVDLRDKLTLAETAWLIQHAKVLLTNDSLPLHMAASCDPHGDINTVWVGMLATAKHPDFLMHYRNDGLGCVRFGWRMVNHSRGGVWSRKGLFEDVKSATKDDMENWLPHPTKLAEWALGKVAMFMTAYQGHPDQRWGHISYAQHGDDFFILNLFDLMGITKPKYLDIGAHHPTTISNTALLYARGCRGVNVEANPNLIEAFKRERPDDINLNVGVAAVPGQLPFFMHHPEAGRNMFDPRERDQIIKEGHPVQETRLITMTTINDIVTKYFGGVWPDLLLTDIEGLDCEVLESADFFMGGETCIGPKVICTEIRQGPDAGRITEILRKRGYTLLCRVVANLFFIRDDFYTRVF